MAVAFLASSDAVASSAAGASNLTTSPNVTISGANVYLIGYAGTGDNTPGGTPASVKWGGSSGESLTQIGTTQTFATNFDHSAWGKTGPTAQTAATYCAWGGAVSETALSMLAYTGVDQTTPHGTPVYQTGHSASPSVTVATAAGDVVVGLLWCGSGGGVPAVTSSQTTRASIADVGGAIYEAMYVLETTASGASTTISASVSGGSAVDWGFIAFKLNAAAAGTTINAGTGALAVAGQSPSVSKTGAQSVAASAGALAVTGQSPSVQNSANVYVTTGAGSLSVAGVVPTLTLQKAAPQPGQLTVVGVAPTVTIGAISVSAGTGALSLAGQAPSVSRTDSHNIATVTGALAIAGVAPVVAAAGAVAANSDTGLLSLAGQVPAVTVSGFVSVAPGAGALTLVSSAPTVARTDNHTILPGAGSVVITAAAPSLSEAGAFDGTAGTGALQITGHAPNVIGMRRTGAGKSSGSKRRRVVIGERVYEVSERDIPALLEAELLDRAPPKTAEVVAGPAPKKRVKKQPVRSVEEVRTTLAKVERAVQAQPDADWLLPALEMVARRVIERIQDEEEALMLLLAA